MSVRSMAKVWDQSQHAGSDLLMLLAIADFADDDGNAYPAVSTLAKKCRMKPRNCQYLLRSLQKTGELSVILNAGPNGSNLYRINLDALGVQHSAGVQSLAGVQRSARGGAKPCAEGVQPVAYKPSVNHQEPSLKRETKKPSRFDVKSFLIDQGVPEQVVFDWLTLRKSKRAAVTKTTIAGIEREAGKAGISLTDALTICCERSWQGFVASWVLTDGKSPVEKPGPQPNPGNTRVRHGITEKFTDGTGWVPA